MLADIFKLPVWNPGLSWAITLVTTLKHLANHAERLLVKHNYQADQRSLDMLRIALNNLSSEHTECREKRATEKAKLEQDLIKQLPAWDDLYRVQQQLFYEMELLSAFCDEMGYTDLQTQNNALFHSSMCLMVYGFAICCKQGRPGEYFLVTMEEGRKLALDYLANPEAETQACDSAEVGSAQCDGNDKVVVLRI